MENNEKYLSKNEQFWQRIVWIAGAFSFIICVLIIVNYAQINRLDPINTEVINKLVERLNQNPEDNELREEIREMDLLVRKAYFTNQWQIRTGGYMLLIGVAIAIIGLQVIITNRKKNPQISDTRDQDLLQKQKITRRWVSLGGTLVVTTALAFAYLSHQSLENRFEIAAEGEPQEIEQQNISTEETVSESIDEDVADDLPPEQTQVVADNQNDSVTESTILKEEELESSVVTTSSEPATTSGEDSFTNFRGPGGNGISTQKNIPENWNGETGENIAWKVAIPLRGFNSPIIWGNKVFLSGAEELRREVYCLNRNSGEFIWTAKVENVPGSPVKGPEVANYTGYAAPTMATDGKRVFAIFSNGDITALDMDGNQIWARNLGAPVNHYGHSSSLMVYNDKVIVQYDQKNLAQILALSVNNGETVWSKTRDVKISWASPVIVNTGNRMGIILAAEPFVISYDPDTGNELWRLDCIYGEVGPSVAYADGIVFSVNDYSKLAAIKIGDTPEILWESEEYLSDIPSPVATDKYLFLATSYGVIVCYDAKKGTILWEHEIDNTIYASPMIVEDKVYLVDKQGIMYIFRVDKEYIPVAQPELGEKIVCTPAFAEGKIYLRGYDHLYCIGK
ncbi:MAG: PQQ-binding-like beta-propeller repeat protein [Bacteroidetes bacterium]|nr:PQQ-binding-like beta-propeller repeat protein [Bacteroidota bacterium]MBL7105043.1 PQQ-binding-like beta-propeller repeat protein [Bacteroidales bacterium]